MAVESIGLRGEFGTHDRTAAAILSDSFVFVNRLEDQLIM